MADTQRRRQLSPPGQRVLWGDPSRGGDLPCDEPVHEVCVSQAGALEEDKRPPVDTTSPSAPTSLCTQLPAPSPGPARSAEGLKAAQAFLRKGSVPTTRAHPPGVRASSYLRGQVGRAPGSAVASAPQPTCPWPPPAPWPTSRTVSSRHPVHPSIPPPIRNSGEITVSPNSLPATSLPVPKVRVGRPHAFS